jgi:aryl-alcohol dehydrogenase-like predicted oxidoreductase
VQTRPLGPGAPAVTAVSFGAMPLSLSERPSEAQALAVLHAVLDAGVTLIDTANVYCRTESDIGHNERLVAQALRTWKGPRESITVATKGGLLRPRGAWVRDGRPEVIQRSCEESLRALAVDRIDLYQLHALDDRVPLADSVGALADLQRAGKIHWIGVSNFSVADIDEALAIGAVVTVQNRLNPFFREALDDGVLEHCRALGIGFLAYSPVGGGRLNRTLPGHAVVARIAQGHGVSAHAVVQAWVLAQAPNTIIIPGARTVAHALDSLTADGLALSADELEQIDRAEFSRA